MSDPSASSSSAGPSYAHLTASSFAPLLRALDPPAPRSSSPRTPAQTSRTFRALAGVRLGAFQKERRRHESREDAPRAKEQASPAYTPFSRSELRRRVCALAAHTPPDETVASARAGWDWHGDAVRCQACQASWTRQSDEREHKEWCPWRVRGCDADMYALPSPSRTELLAELTAQATALSQIPNIEQLSVVHPPLEPLALPFSASLTALALFGWHLGGKTAPTALDSTLVSCDCCGRRLGLWSFTASPGRSLDVRAEHRAFCAYLATDVEGRPAWQARLQTASGKRQAGEENAQVRKLRRSEVLGKVRGMLGE